MAYNKIFDGLSIVHFVLNYILGLYLKNNYVFVFILGIVWEIVEYIITKYPVTRKLLIKYWFIPQRVWDEDLWNKNRVSDLVFNMLGYHFGNQKK